MNPLAEIIKRDLFGETCDHLKLTAGGILIVYFGFNQSPESPPKRLWIDCPWRCKTDESVLVGSLDDSNLVLRRLSCVLNSIVVDVEIRDITGDLHVRFSSGVAIECFCHSISDYHWEVRHSNGVRMGIGPELQIYERIEEADP